MQEIFVFINDLLLIPIPFPLSFTNIVYYNLYGVLIVGFMLCLAIYVIKKLME